MNPELFNRLFEQYTSGVLDEKEKQQLLAMLDDPAYQEVLNSQLYQLYQANGNEETATTLLFDKIHQGVQQRLLQPEKKERPLPEINRLWRYTAAAAMITVLGTGFWLWKMRPAAKNIQPVTEKKTTIPGGNKAVLTLANGEQILLDSAANGTLAQQNGVSIIKQQDGRLAYQTIAGNSQLPATNSLATPRGGQYQLTLPDGTQVWLNTASSIQYPTTFTGKERIVTVTGEAYFEVAQNTNQPFLVNSNNQQIQVLGTAFNINAYQDEPDTRTTLLEGKIRVAAMNTKQSAIVSPGVQAILSTAGDLSTAKANTTEVLAWRNGQIFLTSVSVPVVMRQISRWYDVNIVYEGKIPGNRFFNGIIDRNVPLTSLLEALASNHINTRLEGNTLTVKP